MNAPERTRLPLAAGTLLFAIAGQALALDDPELKPYTKPENSVEAGLGYLSGKGREFGQYTGITDRGLHGLLDVSIVNRDDPTGTWFLLDGRNLGLESREVRIEHTRQGAWGYTIDLGRTPHYEPYVINTRLLVAGPASQTVGGQAARDIELATRRDTIKLGATKTLVGGFDFEVSFRNEEKTGSQFSGQGFFGPFNFLTNPVNQTTRQLDLILNYTTDRLQLTGGYYGTDFINHVPVLGITGGIADLNPMALPPGSQSHQFNLSGGYNFTPATRGTFKAAYTHQTQNETFVAPSINGRTSLGGEVNSTLLQAAITSRPLPKLSLLASVRYEDRDDKTPVAPYQTTDISAASTSDGYNKPASIRSTAARFEATYELPAAFRLTGTLDYDRHERNNSRLQSVGFREDTDETTARVELRRTMFNTLTGSVSFAHSDRGGSDYEVNLLNDNSPGSNQVRPLDIADRKRDKVRLRMNWQPQDALSFGIYADYAKDDYSGRVLGPREGKAGMYALDAAWSISDKWQVSAFLSRNDVKADQSSCNFGTPTGVCVSAVATPLWSATLRNVGDAVGATLRGKPAAGWEVGADATYSRDKSEYKLATTTAAANVGSLPDIYFKVTRLNLFAKYALRKNSDLKLTYIFEDWRTDDWTWTTWTYTDGTRVMRDPTQKVHFIGATFTQRWQ